MHDFYFREVFVVFSVSNVHSVPGKLCAEFPQAWDAGEVAGDTAGKLG